MGEITELLARSATGDGAALDAVFREVYPELRRLAASRLGRGEQTLTPTVLVHEAYLKLIGANALSLSGRRHFFACAARAMRNIVIDRLRSATADKRGGTSRAAILDTLVPDEAEGIEPSPQLLDLDRALDELDAVNPRQREVVELHFFGGLTYAEIAELMGCVERTVIREWQRARAFLHSQLGGSAEGCVEPG